MALVQRTSPRGVENQIAHQPFLPTFRHPLRGVLVEEEGSTYVADNDGDSDDARALRPLQAAAWPCRPAYRIAFGPRAGQKVLMVQGAERGQENRPCGRSPAARRARACKRERGLQGMPRHLPSVKRCKRLDDLRLKDLSTAAALARSARLSRCMLGASPGQARSTASCGSP